MAIGKDERDLADLNVRIGAEETKGDAASKEWLGQVIAPVLAFRRASGKLDGRTAYLAGIGPSAPRETTIQAIEVAGDRAIVRCVVTMKSPDGEKRYDNLRLFVRLDSRWQLLGWANEPRPPGTA